MRGIVIAGTHSGCGKTTVSLGIMAALRKKGLVVQPFKAGPDFIDAGLHRLAADRQSRNLDLWMCGRDYVSRCFSRHAADAEIAVIEGVMGLYDGDRSTASLAALLGAPVVLVVDAYGMAESAGAVVKGFVEFGVRSLRPELRPRVAECGVKFAGVVFNRVASENHFGRLKNSVRDVPVLGYLPRELDFEIPHRHLGLTTAEENPLAGANIDRLADAILKHIDIDMVYESATLDTGAWDRQEKKQSAIRNPQSAIRIAVAYDKAFNFYYEDNLDLLRDAGAEIIRFSPLADPAIPAAADGVYIGGGYPELHTAALAGNSSMRESVRAWVDAGKPLYAECGGLMYLSQGIRDFDNTLVAMAGVFPFETRMMKKPRLGYREIALNEDCILGGRGEKYRGHEFHYSEIEENRVRNAECGVRNDAVEGIYSAFDAKGGKAAVEGLRYKNALASYVHLHFGSNQRGAEYIAGFIKGENKA